jgi:hypothetical protein
MYNNLLQTTSTTPIKHGIISLDESIDDYPTLTITTTEKNSVLPELGSLYSHMGLVFYLETSTIDKVPISDIEIAEQVTLNYIHVSKKILEYPIRLKDFVDRHGSGSAGQTKDTYIVSLATLINYAASKTPYGNVLAANYRVELNRQPSASETITIKSIIDEHKMVHREVMLFNQGYGYMTKLASGKYMDANLVANYTVSRGLSPAFKDSLLEWNKVERYNEEGLQRKKFVKQAYTSYMTYEGDHNPHFPPPEASDSSLVPRDLSIMVDNSGITKQCKITKFTFGQPEVEIEAVFGFAHSALELVEDPTKPNSQTDLISQMLSDDVLSSGNAYQEILGSIANGKYGYPDDADFVNPIVWRLVSIKEKVYYYQPLDIIANPKVKEGDAYISVTVAPGYDKFKKSNAQVLIKEETQGWEIKRFAQESPNDWAKGSIQAWNQLATYMAVKDSLNISDTDYKLMLYLAKVGLEQYLFRKIPLYERIDYAIEPYSRYYIDGDKIDWDVEVMPKSAVTGNLKSGDTQVAVLYPSPNWAPNLMLNSRSRYKSSIGLSGNPDYKLNARNYYGSNPLTITTGSEEFEYTKYLILPSKTTKSTIQSMYVDQTSIAGVLDSITDQINSPGTFYQAHDYMQINDYGIKGIEIGQINPDSVKAGLPSNKTDSEDRYAELTVLHNASDNSFKSKLATRTYNISQGRPPSVSLRFPVFNEIEDDNDNDNNPITDTLTLITSSNARRCSDITPSISISAATNVQEALTGARFKLKLDVMSNNSVSATLNFNFLAQRTITNNTTRFSNVDGLWVIKRANHTIHYTDGRGFVQPVSIEAGLLGQPSLIHKTIPNSDSNNNSSSETGSVTIEANLPNRYGIAYDEVPKGFARWVDL